MMKPLKEGIRLQVTTKSDAEYLYRLMEATMREYVESVWGRWNEAEARRFTREAAASGAFSLIYLETHCVGAINVEEHPAYIQLEQLYIEPQYQRQGIGTYLMRDLMARSTRESRPVRLRVLKPNPAVNTIKDWALG